MLYQGRMITNVFVFKTSSWLKLAIIWTLSGVLLGCGSDSSSRIERRGIEDNPAPIFPSEGEEIVQISLPRDESDEQDSEAQSDDEQGTTLEENNEPYVSSLTYVYVKSSELSENTQVVGRPVTIDVFAEFDNGETAPFNDHVTWQFVRNENSQLMVNDNNQLVAGAPGQYIVNASYRGIFTPDIPILITHSPTVCGGSLNYSGRNVENCLKIVAGIEGEARGKYFTAPPHKSVMTMLGYKEDNTSQNAHYYSYAMMSPDLSNTSYPVYGGRGPFPHALMRSDGRRGMSQAARYCADLASIKFNQRDNWRLPALDELVDLASSTEMMTTYDWPGNGMYLSSDHCEVESVVSSILIYRPNVTEFVSPSRMGYVSCVSY